MHAESSTAADVLSAEQDLKQSMALATAIAADDVPPQQTSSVSFAEELRTQQLVCSDCIHAVVFFAC